MNKDKNYYRFKHDVDPKCSRVVYREWWIVLINLILKILQPWTHDPYLVNVESEIDDNGNPHFIRYCFVKTHLFDGYIDRIKSSLHSGFECEPFYN